MLLCPPSGDLLNPVIEPMSLSLVCWQGVFFYHHTYWKPCPSHMSFSYKSSERRVWVEAGFWHLFSTSPWSSFRPQSFCINPTCTTHHMLYCGFLSHIPHTLSSVLPVRCGTKIAWNYQKASLQKGGGKGVVQVGNTQYTRGVICWHTGKTLIHIVAINNNK